MRRPRSHRRVRRLRATALVWAAAFVWMAAGCVLNALRCHRLHCYISGLVLLLGAIAAAILGAGIVGANAQTLGTIVSTTFGLVLLSYVPEFVWRKYA